MFSELWANYFLNLGTKKPPIFTTTKMLHICTFIKKHHKHTSVLLIYIKLLLWINTVKVNYSTTTKQFITYFFLVFFFFFKTYKIISFKKINPFIVSSTYFTYKPIRRSKIFNPTKVILFLLKYMKDYKVDICKKWNHYHWLFLQKRVGIYSKLNFIHMCGYRIWFFVKTKKDKIYVIFKKKRFLINKPKYSSSSISKFIPNVANLQFQYLRKNKVYNKGRYSRCRQNYRTGVYMCMYLSILSIFGLYYWFFKFSFNFTYLWWPFALFISSFFIPQIIKYRLYNPIVLINKFILLSRWFLIFLRSIWY